MTGIIRRAGVRDLKNTGWTRYDPTGFGPRKPFRQRKNKPTVVHKLPAASLLETIVASVIFLLAFLASMEIVSRLGVTGKRWDQYLAMEEAFERTVKAHRTGSLSRTETDGEVLETEYEWGTIRVSVRPYRNVDGLYELQVYAVSAEFRRNLQVRHLIVLPDGSEVFPE